MAIAHPQVPTLWQRFGARVYDMGATVLDGVGQGALWVAKKSVTHVAAPLLSGTVNRIVWPGTVWGAKNLVAPVAGWMGRNVLAPTAAYAFENGVVRPVAYVAPPVINTLQTGGEVAGAMIEAAANGTGQVLEATGNAVATIRDNARPMAAVAAGNIAHGIQEHGPHMIPAIGNGIGRAIKNYGPPVVSTVASGVGYLGVKTLQHVVGPVCLLGLRGAIGAVETAAPYVKNAYNTVAPPLASAAATGISWSAQRVMENAPSPDTVTTEMREVVKNPKRMVHLWQQTPPAVKAVVTAFSPFGWIWKGPYLAKLAWDNAPDTVREPLREMAGHTFDAATQKYPLLGTIAAEAGPMAAQITRTLQGPIVIAGRNVNPLLAAATDPTRSLQITGNHARELIRYSDSAAIAPTLIPDQLPHAEPQDLIRPNPEVAHQPQPAVVAAPHREPVAAPIPLHAPAPLPEPVLEHPDAAPHPAPVAVHVANPHPVSAPSLHSAALPLVEQPPLHEAQPLPIAVAAPVLAGPALRPVIQPAVVINVNPAAVPQEFEDVPPAIGPQARIDATDWRAKADMHLDEFSEKSSYFGLFAYMYYKICKIKEPNNLSLLKLVQEASKPEKPNVWDLFAKQYKLTPKDANWWKCKFFYWRYYKWSSLIPNSVHSFFTKKLADIRSDFSDKDKVQARSDVLEKTLDLFSEYFDAFKRSCKAYVKNCDNPKNLDAGDLDTCKRTAIAQHYNNSLEQLCRDFSSKLVHDSSKVEFFKESKKKPYIGKIISILVAIPEWFLNVVLRIVMRFYVLPPILKDVVDESLDAAKPHRIIFSLALTRFLTAQFQKLKTKMANKQVDMNPLAPIPGTEKLPTVVKKLIEVIALAPHQTDVELKAVFKDLAKGKTGFDAAVQKGIHEGVQKALHLLFEFLTDPKNLEETFANLFEQLNAPFSGNVPLDETGWKKLALEFDDEKKLLKKEAHEVFETIITEAVSDEIDGMQSENAVQSADRAFQAQKNEAQVTFDQLHYLQTRMAEKVARNSGAEANSIHPEITAFAHKMSAFTDKERVHLQLNGLAPAARESIHRALAPLYQGSEQLMVRLKRLSGLQTEFTSHEQIVEELTKLNEEILASVPHRVQNTPSQLLEITPFLSTAVDRISKHLAPDEPIIQDLRTSIAALHEHLEGVVQEQHILDGLESIYPNNDGDLEVQKNGLIYQLGFAIRYRHQPDALREHLPANFKQPVCIEQINEVIELLDPTDQAVLRRKIDEIQNFPRQPIGRDFNELWGELDVIMRNICQKYARNKEVHKAGVERTLAQFSQSVQRKTAAYNHRKETNHRDMVQETNQVTQLIGQIRDGALQVQQQAQSHLSTEQIGLLTGGLGFLSGLIFGPVAGAIVGAGSYLAVNNLGRSKEQVALATVGGAGLAGLAAATLPGAVASIPLVDSLAGPVVNLATSRLGGAVLGAAGAGSAGANLTDGAIGAIRSNVVPEIMKLFENAYEHLVLSRHTSHAALTWGMKSLAPKPASGLGDFFQILVS